VEAGEFASVNVKDGDEDPVYGAQIYANDEAIGVTNEAGQYTVPISSSASEVEFRVEKGNSSETLVKDVTGSSGTGSQDTNLDGNVELSSSIPSETNKNSNLDISWESTNRYDINHRLISSTITISSSNEEIEREINRGNSYENGETANEEVAFTRSDLSELGSGPWTVEIEDRWDHDIETTEQEVTVNEPDFYTGINSPEQGNSYKIGENFALNVETEAKSDAEQTVETDISVSDSSGNSVEEQLAKTISAGETSTFSNEFAASELESLNVGDSWTVSATAEGTDTGSTSADSIQIETRQPEEDPEGSVSTTMVSPTSDTEVAMGNDSIDVEWNSQNDYNVENTIYESKISITDDSGGSYVNTVSRSESIAEGASASNLEIVTSELIELSSLSEGTWTVSVEDRWEYGSDTAEVGSIQATSSGSDSNDENVNEDDSGNTQESANIFIQSPSDGDSLTGPVVNYDFNVDNVDNDMTTYQIIKGGENVAEGNLSQGSNSISREIMTQESGDQDYKINVTDDYWNEEYTSGTKTFSTERAEGDFIDIESFSPRDFGFTSNNNVQFEMTFNQVLDNIDAELYINEELEREFTITSGSSSHTEEVTLNQGEYEYRYLLESQETPETLNTSIRTFEVGSN
jgi:hypothetical protein